MIDRILENWLDKSSERSYQIPFCYLLVQKNMTILHLTRHNAMEHGKDIIAQDQSGQLHVYQLKGINGGKLKIRDWQAMLGQLMQMVTTPVIHPSASTDRHQISYLVLNGEIEEEVSAAISAFNSDWKSKGFEQYCINTIVRGQILSWAKELKDQLVPSELSDFKLLLEFFLDSGKGLLDKGKFCRLLDSIFNNAPKNDEETKRLLSSAAVLCSLALSQFQENQNHVSIIEGWTIYIAQIMQYAERFGLKRKIFSNEMEIADKVIINALDDLSEEVILMKDGLQSDLMQDIFVFRHRLTVLLGYLAYYGIRLAYDPSANENKIGEIFKSIETHIHDIAIWGESAVPHVTNIYWFYKKIGKEEKSRQLLKSVFLLTILEGKKEQSLFTNYYLSAEDTLILLHDERTQPRDIALVASTRHVNESLTHLLVINNEKELLKDLWKDISTFIYVSFEFERKEDIFKWRNESGTEVTRYQKEYMEWADFVEEAKKVDVAMLPSMFLERHLYAPLFVIVYPHRYLRNLIIWIETNLFEKTE